MKAYERIDNSEKFDGKIRESHELRYFIARGFLLPEDRVLDAGCGTGYGRHILEAKNYIGIDRKPPEGECFMGYDFEIGSPKWDWDLVDVFIGFEIIEHLNNNGVSNFKNMAKDITKRWIIISTPIIPNSNPYHKQNFTARQIVRKFTDENWKLFGTVEQNKTYGIFIFKNYGKN